MRGLMVILAAWFGVGSAAATSFTTLPGPAIALTFDDLPAHGALPTGETRLTIVRSILATLSAHKVRQVSGFVAGSFGSGDPLAGDVLRAWRSAGYPLGNHSWSHTSLDAVDVGTYIDDIARNEAVIAPLMRGADWHWFRYPYLAEGVDPAHHEIVRAALAKSRYRVASVTLNFDDWSYNGPYARCAANGDAAAIRLLESVWLAAADASLARSRLLARTATGREIPLVLLLHVGAFTARMLPRLLDFYETKGSRFVSLAKAETDPFYAGDVRHVASGSRIVLEIAARTPDKPFLSPLVETLPLTTLCT